MSAPTKRKLPMRAFLNADSVEYQCPCGASVVGEDAPVTRFVAAHRDHTNGKCIETVTADGARFVVPGKPRTFTL